MKEHILLEDITCLNKSNFSHVEGSIRSIIKSRLSIYNDLNDYLDDLVSNAFIVLLRSAKRYNPDKSKFSTYVFNRVVSSSRKLYMALKFPYGGIKALSGKSKVLQSLFLESNLAYFGNPEELNLIPDPKYMEY
jgi:hypothetical protein